MNYMQGRISKCGKFLIHNDHIHEVLGKVIIGYSRKIHMKGGTKSRWVAQINACIHMTTMSFGIWQLGFWIARDWDMIQNTFELHSFQIHFERFIQCDHWHINHKCGVKWSFCMYVCEFYDCDLLSPQYILTKAYPPQNELNEVWRVFWV